MKNKRQLTEGILFTDQYQLTMAQLYFKLGIHEKRAQFDHFFRSYPQYVGHQAGYCISAGLEPLVEWMQAVRFEELELAQLRGQKDSNGRSLFQEDFLQWLAKDGNFNQIQLQAIPEGRVVHPHVPLAMVEGPLAMAQILETALLNKLNFPTLIATKASRINQAAGGRTVMEFGMRRAQGYAANAGARAALIGGADFSSNVGISHALGFAPKGTHAHSMIQTFIALGGTELDAFQAYADLYPDDCVLLVDTVNTLESGVPNAIRVFEGLEKKGHRPIGVRLDSGDLAYLSIQTANLLNEAGFPDVSIILSNNLDELTIWQIITQIRQEGVRYGVEPERVIDRLVYGVGTQLITSGGDSALGGVYKLVAIENRGDWSPAIKISENPIKIPNPGQKKGWRIYDRRGMATADLLTLAEENPAVMEEIQLHHPGDHSHKRLIRQEEIVEIEPLLREITNEGKVTYQFPTMEQIRAQRDEDLGRLDGGVRRLINPHIYHVSLSQKLWDLKQALIAAQK